MKVITTIQELDNAIKELRAEAIINDYNDFRFYIAGEELIREAAAKYNLTTSFWKGLNGLFSEANINVKGLSLSGSELEFVPVAIIEGATNGDYIGK